MATYMLVASPSVVGQKTEEVLNELSSKRYPDKIEMKAEIERVLGHPNEFGYYKLFTAKAFRQLWNDSTVGDKSLISPQASYLAILKVKRKKWKGK